MTRYKDAARVGRSIGERLSCMVRPSVEALLLAAVALGCAQAGWTLLTPGSASASSNATNSEGAAEPFLETAEVRSPFAPDATGAGSHVIEALLSSVQLNGIRMSTEPARSGAMFTLADGGHRAFMVGQEVVDGVVLSEVTADYVLLSYDGGQHRVDMAAAPAFSFARAMMGLEPASGAEPPASASQSDDQADAQHHLSAADQAWLARTLSQVEARDGRAVGWRVADAPPGAVTRAGLQSGDLVVGVNGAGPDNLAAVAAAAQSNTLVLEIERGRGRITITVEAGERT